MAENNLTDDASIRDAIDEAADKFEETLRQIEQADPVDKKYKRKKISGRLLIAAAVICTGMAVTVAAKEFIKWNDYLVKRLDPSEEQQETLQ